MRNEHHRWLFGSDSLRNLFCGHRGVCRFGGVIRSLRLKHSDGVGHSPCFKYLRPAIAEPPVANNKAPLAIRELSGYGFHSKTTAPGYNYGALGVIYLPER